MFDLEPYNTFGLRVAAQNGLIVNKQSDLKRLKQNHYIIIGHGSDLLLTEDFEGTVLIDRIGGVQITQEQDSYLISAGSGVVLDSLIAQLVEKNICGLENLSAIPGTVGAAPIQNIGAYGVEIGNFIEQVHTIDLVSKEQRTFLKEQCEFAYRSSYFKTHKKLPLFITQVDFRLPKSFTPVISYAGLNQQDLNTPAQIRAKVIELRSQKLPDPKVVGNAGSFFKNPVVDAKQFSLLQEKYPQMPYYYAEDGQIKLAAGWLIDKAGCRGITHGRAGTWEKQALVLVNRGGALPLEIVALAKYIQAEVHAKFGITLEPEVRIYGRRGEITWDQL